MPTTTNDALLADLDTRPEATLATLAEVVDGLHRSMGAGDQLRFESGTKTFVMGRHEVPALAMLFRNADASETAREDALRRARGYLQTAEHITRP